MHESYSYDLIWNLWRILKAEGLQKKRRLKLFLHEERAVWWWGDAAVRSPDAGIQVQPPLCYQLCSSESITQGHQISVQLSRNPEAVNQRPGSPPHFRS